MKHGLFNSAENERRFRRSFYGVHFGGFLLAFPICGGRDVSWETAETLVPSVCGALSESAVNADMLPPYLPKVCRNARRWLERQTLTAVPAFDGPQIHWEFLFPDALRDVMRMIAIVRICSEEGFRRLLSDESKSAVDLFCRTFALETMICSLGCAVFSADGGNAAAEWNLEE